jgi:hypothetical protein
MPHCEPYPHVRNPSYFTLAESNFEFIDSENPLDFVIKRKDTGEQIFRLSDLIYTNYFIEFSWEGSSQELYGLGERLYRLQFKPGKFTLYIFDRFGMIDDGTPGHNQQGHHSMYLMKEKSKKYHVGLFRNINSQEVEIRESGVNKWRTIGGVVDWHFFLGEDPEDAI